MSRFLIRRDDFSIGIHGSALCGDLVVGYAGKALRNGFLGFINGFDFASLTPDLLQVVEVVLTDWCDIGTAEDTDFEVLRFCLAVFPGNLSASSLEIIESLEDNVFGADVAGNGFCVAVVGDQLVGGSKVDTIDVSMTKELLAKVFQDELGQLT